MSRTKSSNEGFLRLKESKKATLDYFESKTNDTSELGRSVLSGKKVTFEFLKTHLFVAADILRGSLDPSQYRQPVMTILFIKRLNDRFEEKAEDLINHGKSKKEAFENPARHNFFIPKDARWSVLSSTAQNIGEKIDHICRLIERENPILDGVMTNTTYNDKKMYPDDKLRKLVSHFNQPRLRNSDLEKEDIFGDAYEYLLAEFADETKKKGGEFFTPREIVRLLVNLVEPRDGMTICDPTCGSGGMLIESRKYVERSGGNPRNLILEGQESNYGNLAMCKMNMVLHDILDFEIEYGDVLAEPKLLVAGKLKEYDRVLANFPFSMDWDNSIASGDSHHRFKYGVPPSKDKADFAFIQHMLASLNEKGQAAIICSQGILFRGNEESNIRERMILGDTDEHLQGDVIEGIIALPSNLFYGTGIPACVLVLNRQKPQERRNRIIFIYAAKDFEERPNRNILRQSDIVKITAAFANFRDIDYYCHVADIDELRENEFNLNVPRYVDITEPEGEIDIQETIQDLKKLEQERGPIEREMQQNLKELGYRF
jgi:type I restriction enzyme M protein